MIDWSRPVVPEDKLIAYLLALDHPEGGSKASFFHGLGFARDDPRRFAEALRFHAAAGATVAKPGPHGVKYVVEGPLTGVDRRTRPLRSVWIVEAEGEPPRLVTAYPSEA